MQFTIAFASTLLAFASGINALPSPSSVTLRIFNDVTGANAEATVPADNLARSIPILFGGSAIDTDGIVGTSAQLTRFADNTKCTLNNINYPGWVIELDGRGKNFVDLDGDSSKPIPIWLGGFNFQCTQV
ncbi:hypothetical protein IQ07DRAFT_593506 [Pyrenochaeta sp. DS3sAY3a]|nr:hypothetical protein IQ07DRAFT_593506 [Pyrenochaeta sp. DS3sAY3a]